MWVEKINRRMARKSWFRGKWLRFILEAKIRKQRKRMFLSFPGNFFVIRGMEHLLSGE
jgi:hypothetical protein